MLNQTRSFIALALFLCAQSALAQSTAFTYQGKLTDGDNPASGPYDFQIKLFDTQAVGTGTQQGITVTVSNITVNGGIFTVPVDFGVCPSCFNGASRFLEIAVKPTSGGAFTTLGPRQPITSTPYAIRSLNATTADGLSAACLSCITSSQIQSVSGSTVTGTIPAASLPAGSDKYIQSNPPTQQASANFNISGNGTAGGVLSANLLNATTQFNLGGNRIVSNAGTSNLFVGVQAGAVNSTGSDNSFFGAAAGQANIAGFNNSFFGRGAGISTTSNYNSIFGAYAGQAPSTGNNNSFFGSDAGSANTMGFDNAFFGHRAGFSNEMGGANSFFGFRAGYLNNGGTENAFFGYAAGYANEMGTQNTAIGSGASVSSGNLSHATAIGAGTIVTASNRVQIGRPPDASQPGDTVAIGAFASPPTSKPVCINGQGVFASCAQIANPICINANGDFIVCGSSLRYKSNIQAFPHGMALLQKLRPVAYTWKEDGRADVGLIAEEVAEVEPRLTIYNTKGEIEGVKYAQLTVVLINAVKEQQIQLETQTKQLETQTRQIAAQQSVLKQQQQQLDALKKLVCQTNPQAAACQE